MRVVGGTVGRVSITTDADPKFNNSEKVLLYLCNDTSPATKDIGPEHFVVTNFYQGKYTLTDDERAITPDENITLSELLSTISQTNNKANDTEISNSTEISNNSEVSNSEEISNNSEVSNSEEISNNSEVSNSEEISNSTENTAKQEVNSSSTLESENVPFISSFWALTGLFGAFLIVRHRHQ
ncbi:MAG: hypothetical protein ACOX7X_10385 [Methanosarcina flavescens]|uniref:hypothetical protein n=1 Tax=Methanosarcina flavescens TaxID=1715806 RepID=UPI000AA5DDF1|nr:hypothetical protein [Methanosarcina flavescens]